VGMVPVRGSVDTLGERCKDDCLGAEEQEGLESVVALLRSRASSKAVSLIKECRPCVKGSTRLTIIHFANDIPSSEL